MLVEFFSREVEVRGQQLQDELYERLRVSRLLLESYDLDWVNLQPYERGYAQAVREEVRYLERLIDCLERS